MFRALHECLQPPLGLLTLLSNQGPFKWFMSMHILHSTSYLVFFLISHNPCILIYLCFQSHMHMNIKGEYLSSNPNASSLKQVEHNLSPFLCLLTKFTALGFSSNGFPEFGSRLCRSSYSQHFNEEHPCILIRLILLLLIPIDHRSTHIYIQMQYCVSLTWPHNSNVKIIM